MSKPRVLILRAPGTNCDWETAYAFECAGALAERLHVRRLLENPRLLTGYQILCIPGGFSYGDDIAAGKILAVQLQHHLFPALQEFHQAGKLILGICNGFQVLLKSGLLIPPDDAGRPVATLTWNTTPRYEDRWVHLEVAQEQCVFLREIQRLELPIAHAEGRFVVREMATLEQLHAAGYLAIRYAWPPSLDRRLFAEASTATQAASLPGGSSLAATAGRTPLPAPQPAEQLHLDWRRNLPYPWNPNGSLGNVAGVCDATGRVLGLMPHPERFIDSTHHPRWPRGEWHAPPHGLRLFVNAVRYFE